MATKLDMAEQQLYGWSCAQQGERLIKMIDGMGLGAKEWGKLRREGSVEYLGGDQIDEVTNHLLSK